MRLPNHPTAHQLTAVQSTVRPPVKAFDIDVIASLVDQEACELIDRCEVLAAVWRDIVESADANGVESCDLDPGAAMVPYDDLPEVRDIARRVQSAGSWLRILAHLSAQVGPNGKEGQ